MISTIIRRYIASIFSWQKGRQNTGYEKMLLFTASWPIILDSYIIKYPVGSEIPPHVDPIIHGKHYRLNIVIKPSHDGGNFICKNSIINTKRIKLFRPDIHLHSVTKILSGTRYVLSIGCVIQ